jgi:hypothetical protein
MNLKEGLMDCGDLQLVHSAHARFEAGVKCGSML